MPADGRGWATAEAWPGRSASGHARYSGRAKAGFVCLLLAAGAGSGYQGRCSYHGGEVRVAIAIVLAGLVTVGDASPTRAEGPYVPPGAACSRPDFEQVVEGAAASLRDLNARNGPNFQDKLRLLRERRNWSAEEFMVKAAPFVQDDKITAYDQRSNDLLTKINSMGEAGASAKTPDCKLLDELRSTMQALIDTQIEKWAYMFAKIEKGLVTN